MSLFKNYIERVASQPLTRKIVRYLGLSSFGKKIYFALFAPADKKVSLKVGDITAQFYVHNHTELIYLTKTIVGAGDERHIIKKILNAINPGDVVFDVGTFLGLHAIFFAKKVGKEGRVIAFEPSLLNYQHLLKNLALNKLTNVTAINMGLGERMGKILLYVGNDQSMYSMNHHVKNNNASEEVSIASGDSLVSQNKIPPANVIKVDVEGYEYSVILGLEKVLRQPTCRMLCCEVHTFLLPHGITDDMVINKLKDFGFTNIIKSSRGDTYHIFCYKNNES